MHVHYMYMSVFKEVVTDSHTELNLFDSFFLNKMINGEWLCSSLKLCDLTVSESVHTDDSTEIVINMNSFPQPAYNPSSINITLEAYSLLFDTTFGQNMKDIDQKIMEHEYAQIESIYYFAQMTAKTIIDSVMMKNVTPSAEYCVDYHPDNTYCNLTDLREPVTMREDHVEMLAEELTLQACCKAMEEIGRCCVLRSDDPSVLNILSKEKNNKVMDGVFVPCPSGYNCAEDTSEMEKDTKMEEYDYKFSAAACAASLKSMANLGSIEYPDAPPSTPLLPEMLKSRDSFSRKLKGGLAKEFLPSPPPPTPKDQMQPLLENQMTDTSSDKSDFMTRLMRSLSLECCRQGGLEEQKAGEVNDSGLQNETQRLFDYAAQLSADILLFITTSDTEENKRIWDIAEQLANEIVITSLAEMMVRDNKENRRGQNGHMSIIVDTISLLEVASQQRPSMACSAAEEIIANKLIINAVVHAFAKLKQGAFKHGTLPHPLDQAAEQQPWEKERYSNTHLCKDPIQSKKGTTVSCCSDKLELSCITFEERHENAIKMTSYVNTYANTFAEVLLKNSVRDVSSLLVNFRQSQETHVKTCSQRDMPCVIKMHAEESCDDLQCALLWAAASQKGTSELQFHLLDTNLKQQLCRLSRTAHLSSWTVGTLMASLCQFCNMQQEASRGQYKSSDSLLEYLQHVIDNTPLN